MKVCVLRKESMPQSSAKGIPPSAGGSERRFFIKIYDFLKEPLHQNSPKRFLCLEGVLRRNIHYNTWFP